MSSQQKLGALLILPALGLIMLFLLLPIATAVVTSLQRDTPFAPRAFVGLQNYVEFFRDPAAAESRAFTFIFVVVSVTLEILCGLFMALLIHQSFRGRGLVRAAVLIPWAIPTVVTAVLWKYMLNDQYGLLNLSSQPIKDEMRIEPRPARSHLQR